MQIATLFLSILALSTLSITSAQAMDYRTHDRLYANDAHTGGSNYYGHNRRGYGSISGASYNPYRQGTRARINNQQNLNSTRRTTKSLAPTYVRKPINFTQNVGTVQQHRLALSANKRVEGRQSNAALNARLINMKGKKQPRKPVQSEHRVVLPRVGIAQQQPQQYTTPQRADRVALYQPQPTTRHTGGVRTMPHYDHIGVVGGGS